MNILITGGAGFLGQQLIGALLERDGLDLGAGRQPIGRLVCFDQTEGAIVDPRVRNVAGNIADPSAVAALVGPDTAVVVHLAAVVSGTATLQAAQSVGSGSSLDGVAYVGDTVSITGTAAGSYNSQHVASANMVTFSGLSLTGADANNYTLTIQAPASATITPKALTITANNATKIYGETPTLGGSAFTSSGLVTGETIGSVTLSSGGTAVSANVGNHAITPSAASGGSFTVSNYAIDYRDGTLTVGQRPITVTAISGQGKVYGEADPSLHYTLESNSSGRGLVGSDVFSGALARAAGETVGASYAIGLGTLANNNYAISFTGSDFAITRRPITITATAASKIYGAADPILAVTAAANSAGTGLATTASSNTVNDTLAEVVGTLSRQSGSNVGSYDIALGTGAKTANYDITFNADNNAVGYFSKQQFT